MKKDDSTLEPQQLDNVKKYAKVLLHEADALNQFPTPVDRLIKTAKLDVNKEVSLGRNDNLIRKFNSRLGKLARPQIHGLKKLLGMLHVPSGEIYIDHAQHEKKKIWIKLHETGHGFIPHQRKMYEFMEDGKLELDPEINDIFEREANNFAAETLFQLDTYEKIAADYRIAIQTPVDLAQKFGSSIYSSIRRYVQTHFAPIALAVYNFPKESESFKLRRLPMHSNSFLKKFGSVNFPPNCEKFGFLGSILNTSQYQTNQICGLQDLNEDIHETSIHVFTNTYEIFVMLIPGEITSNDKVPFSLNDTSIMTNL